MSSVELPKDLPYGIRFYMKLPYCWRVDLIYLKPDWFLVDAPTDSFLKELYVMAGMDVPVNLDKLVWYFYSGTPPLIIADHVKSPLDILFVTIGEYKDKSLSNLVDLNLPLEEWKKVGQTAPPVLA